MKCRCGKEMFQVGFNQEKGENYYICRNEDCPKYKDILALPSEEEKGT